MSQELQHLLKQLNLESLEKGLFRGQSENLGLPQVYGGQVLGQALSAANQTVDNSRKVHSQLFFTARGHSKAHCL